MPTSYSVKIWELQTRHRTNAKGERVPARYVVRWIVDKERFDKSFKNKTQADSFRSDLISAARKGEAFDLDEGLPVSMVRAERRQMSWLALAGKFIDMKWQDSSPKHRSSITDSLVSITLAVLPEHGRPSLKVLSPALRREFNKNQRGSEYGPDTRAALEWVREHSPDVSALDDPDTLRSVLAELDTKRDGQRAAHDTIRLRRGHFRAVLDYGVELGVFAANPMDGMKLRRRNSVLRQVDRRTVPNPRQAKRLLEAARQDSPRLVAFFGLLYYAGLRPEEAANLRKSNLSIPDEGEGELYLERASPEVGEHWTDSQTANEERPLKHRDNDAGRMVPCPEELTVLLHDHLAAYGDEAADGRLFCGEKNGGRLGSSVYGRAWARVRQVALTKEELAAQLAVRPYDLRHAALSTWLNATGDPVRVAEWAGNSPRVLLHTYAKCLDGGEADARRKVAERLKWVE